jgi:hypothetical protein
MDSHTKKRLKGAITTYVMMMFGLIVVLYLMGFTNPFDAYSRSQNLPTLYETDADGNYVRDINGQKIPLRDENGNILHANITKPSGIGTNVLSWLMDGIQGLFQKNPEGGILGVVATILTIVGLFILAKAGGQYVIAYIVPLIILGIFANIFLFPTSSLQATIPFPLDMITFTFLNLFLILSYLEFILGGPK